MTPDQIERYARHIMLKDIGGPGQQALLKARVAIVGVGGLGGPAGLYLAAAGIGQITLIDDDDVDVSNLQRQIQFVNGDIAVPKTQSMKSRLVAMNPDVNVHSMTERLTMENAEDLLENHDLVLDGTDSFQTRFLVNKTALKLGIPLVSGAIGRFDGQVALFPSDGQSPCYQCLVPVEPEGIETCSELGVIGALAGVIGSLMALEAIKHITGAGETLTGRLWVFDGLYGESRTVKLVRDPDCPACSDYSE